MKNNIFSSILNEFYKKDKYKFYFLFILSVIAGLFEFLGLVLIFQFVLFLLNPDSAYAIRVIDFFSSNLKIYDTSKIGLVIGVIIALIYIFKNIYMLIFTKLNNCILEDLSVKMTLKTVKNLLYGDYILLNSISASEKLDILNKITYVVWEYCLKYVNMVSNIIIAVILLLYLFIKFTFCAVVSFFIIGFLSIIEYLYLKKCSNFQNKNFSPCQKNINNIILTIIDSFKEIKLNNKEKYFYDLSEKSYKKFALLNKDKSFNNVFHIYFTEISIMLAFIAVLFILFYTSNFDNGILITSVTTICVTVLRLTPVINRAQSAIYSINSSKKTSIEVIKFNRQFMDAAYENVGFEKLPFYNSITLKNICFKYKKDDIGLNDINIKINKGDFMGIVGENGCYKTTLALIIAGFIKPLSGEILIDNKPIRDYRKWQNNIAFLNQDYKPIFDNIYENISFDKNYNKDKIDKILAELNLNELTNKTDINSLSQGQKQRVLIASMLYKEKDIIILDEATSSSDVVSEEYINEILNNLKGKKTIISIAHRLQILKHCTKTIYMEKGRIVDIDTFLNLEKKYPKFKNIIELSSFKPQQFN